MPHIYPLNWASRLRKYHHALLTHSLTSPYQHLDRPYTYFYHWYIITHTLLPTHYYPQHTYVHICIQRRMRPQMHLAPPDAPCVTGSLTGSYLPTRHLPANPLVRRKVPVPAADWTDCCNSPDARAHREFCRRGGRHRKEPGDALETPIGYNPRGSEIPSGPAPLVCQVYVFPPTGMQCVIVLLLLLPLRQRVRDTPRKPSVFSRATPGDQHSLLPISTPKHSHHPFVFDYGGHIVSRGSPDAS